MSDELEKQIVKEEKLYSDEVSNLLTAHLNSRKVRARADELNSTSGRWPYPPSPELRELLTEEMIAEWGRLKRKYDNFEEKDAPVLQHKKGKTPSVVASLKYRGDWCGGKSVVLKKGDDIAKLAKKEYGFEAYAAAIWEANDTVLGSACKVLPAGFGLELPQIWVPRWVKAPKFRIPMAAPAEEFQRIPSIEMDFSTKSSSTWVQDLGVVILEVDFTITGEVKIANKGTVDVTFDPKAQTVAIGKALGPLTTGYTADFKSKSDSGSATLALFNKDVAGLKFSGRLALASGGISVNLGVAQVLFSDGDLTITGSFKAKADLRLYPKPRPVESDVYAASVAANLVVVAAVVIILRPVAVRVLPSGAAARQAGKAVLDKLMEYGTKIPEAIPAGG